MSKIKLTRLTVVGLRFYITDDVWINNINLGDEVEVIKEPDNQYDKYAMAVCHSDNKIGYVSKDENKFCDEGIYKITMKQGLSSPVIMMIQKRIEEVKNEN